MESHELKPITPPAPPAAPAPPASGTPPAPSASGTKVGRVTQVTVGGYWINHYRKQLCRQTTTDFCDRLVFGFTTRMALSGHRIGIIRSEGKASPSQWSAWADKNPGGIDTVEFGYLATHGGTYGHELKATKTGTNWVHWFMATFDNPNEANRVDEKGELHKGWSGCFISTLKLAWDPKDDKVPNVGKWVLQNPATPTPMLVLGDGSLRWAVLDACRSLQVRLENDSTRHTAENETEAEFMERTKQLAEARPDRTWRWCLDGVNMLFGFTGLCSDAGWTAQRGSSFGQRVGRGEAMADSWIDEAYSWLADDAPVVLACGRSGKDSEQRLMTESLAAVAPTIRAAEIGGFTYMWRS